MASKCCLTYFLWESQIKLTVAYLAGKALLGWLQMHSREIACFSSIRGMEDACHAAMESGRQPTAVLHFFPVGFGWKVSKRISFKIPGKLVTEGALANGMRRYALYLGVGGFPHFYPIKSAIFLRIAPPPTVMFFFLGLLKTKVTNAVVTYIYIYSQFCSPILRQFLRHSFFNMYV